MPSNFTCQVFLSCCMNGKEDEQRMALLTKSATVRAVCFWLWLLIVLVYILSSLKSSSATSSGQMVQPFQFIQVSADKANVVKYVLMNNDSRVTFAEFLALLSRSDSLIHDLFFEVLRNQEYSSYFFECPSITMSTVATTGFEFILASSPTLSTRAVDKTPFETHFINAVAKGLSVVSFANLGGDSCLVVPCPPNLTEDMPSYFTHLASFMRAASREQVMTFWKVAANEIISNLQRNPPDQKMWVSTSGLGVSWLHLRLDSYPKYYSYEPYRSSAM